MLPGAQFAWDQFAVCEQCGETSQHAATHPKVNIESQGLERTARLPDYRSSDLAMLTDDNDIDAVVDSTIQLLTRAANMMLCAGQDRS